MTNDFKYYLHCSNCNLKRYTNGMDLDDLIEIKRTQPMRLVPKVDKYSGKLVVPPDVKRPKVQVPKVRLHFAWAHNSGSTKPRGK